MRLFCHSKKAGAKQASKRGGGLFVSRKQHTAAAQAAPISDGTAERVEEQEAAAAGPVVVPPLRLAALSLNDGTFEEDGCAEPAATAAGSEDAGGSEPAATCPAPGPAERASELAAAAQDAKAHRSSCLALAGSAANVVEALQEGEALLPATSIGCLSQLGSLFGNAATLAASCGTDGWLLTASTCDGGAGDALQLLQTKMVAVLKGEGLACLPSLARLPAPEVHNGARTLHRRLRQLGSGSLAAGLALLAGDEDEQRKLAEALRVQSQDIASDAAHILEAGLLAEEDSAATAAADVLAEHRPALATTFSAFASFGLRGEAAGAAPDLDSFRCTKLAREAGLLDSSLTTQALDVLFAAAKERGARRLSFDAFLRLLRAIADKKGVPLGEVAAAVAAVQVPAVRATTPEAVKFHDDRSLYTGVYRGGMSVVDDRPDLSRLVDRDAAEKAQRRATITGCAAHRTSTSSVALPLSRTPSTALGSGAATPRGCNSVVLKTPGTAASTSGAATPRFPPSAGGARGGLTPRGAALTPRVVPLASPRLPPASAATAAVEDMAENRNLRRVHDQFASFGRSQGAGGELILDSAQFAKICRDAKLLGRGLSSTRVDLIFTGAAGAKGTRRMSFQAFLGSLPKLGEARGCTREDVVQRLLACEGPALSHATTPDAVRLFDDKSNFSGERGSKRTVGIAGRGGPSTVEKERVTLEGLCDRSGRRTSLAPVL
ncbi:hypothetical protein ABPG75_012077 [Micractinium tetrahymenae]